MPEQPISESTDAVEQNKITISAIFIATYTALLFSLPQIFPFSPYSLLKEVLYTVFIIDGALIDAVFFLYIAFYALELSSRKIKIITFFDVRIEQSEIRKLKNGLFNAGIDFIFISFSSPFLVLGQKTESFSIKYFHGWIGILIGLVAFALIVTIAGIAIRFLFRRLKSK